MINKDTLVKVINKDSGVVGYTIPELGVHRNFHANETKEVTFGELESLTFIPGGETILKEYLEIVDNEAAQKLFPSSLEPEYHYTKDDVKKLMEIGTLDQFLDCLDFAPEVIKELIKTMAVELPLNDMSKREAIKEKLGFDVSKAIEIKNTKYDGDNDEDQSTNTVSSRRAKPITDTQEKKTIATPSGRRYKPITKDE